MSATQSAQPPASNATHAAATARRVRPPVAEVGSVRAACSRWPLVVALVAVGVSCP